MKGTSNTLTVEEIEEQEGSQLQIKKSQLEALENDALNYVVNKRRLTILVVVLCLIVGIVVGRMFRVSKLKNVKRKKGKVR